MLKYSNLKKHKIKYQIMSQLYLRNVHNHLPNLNIFTLKTI